MDLNDVSVKKDIIELTSEQSAKMSVTLIKAIIEVRVNEPQLAVELDYIYSMLPGNRTVITHSST